MMTKIDVADAKRAVEDLNGIEPFNEVMTFFYDESGNCRKFSLTENGVNSVDALKGDFVLAGVAYEGVDKKIDVSGLYQALDFKEGQKELKYRHLYNKSKDFLSFMGSARATAFLEWLEKSGLYIHYSALNNLFYSIADIVDSLLVMFPQCFMYMWQIKSALYDMVRAYQTEIIHLLYRFDYPNVSDCNVFCVELCKYIKKYKSSTRDIPSASYLEVLRRLLVEAGTQGELAFIQDNAPFVLINGYYQFYIERCMIFSRSVHVFDEEPTVQKQLQNVELVENGKTFRNYRFVASNTEILVQVSDLIAGFLRGLFAFLDSAPLERIDELNHELNSTQIANFSTMNELISKSNAKSRLLLKNANTPNNVFDRERKLQILSGR